MVCVGVKFIHNTYRVGCREERASGNAARCLRNGAPRSLESGLAVAERVGSLRLLGAREVTPGELEQPRRADDVQPLRQCAVLQVGHLQDAGHHVLATDEHQLAAGLVLDERVVGGVANSGVTDLVGPAEPVDRRGDPPGLEVLDDAAQTHSLQLSSRQCQADALTLAAYMRK